MNDKGHIIAFALALAPAAFIAWASKTRSVFIAGAVGAIVGLYVAPNVTSERTGCNQRDAIIDTVGLDAPYTLVGAIVGGCLFLPCPWTPRKKPLKRTGANHA